MGAFNIYARRRLTNANDDAPPHPIVFLSSSSIFLSFRAFLSSVSAKPLEIFGLSLRSLFFDVAAMKVPLRPLFSNKYGIARFCLCKIALTPFSRPTLAK